MDRKVLYMKRTRKIASIGIISSVIFFGGATSVLATWSSVVTTGLSPWGQTVDIMDTAVLKTTASSSVSVYGVRETNSLDPHVKLINSDRQSRSDWCAVRQGETTSGFSSAMVNYYCYSRAGSNTLEPNYTNVQYQYNPY